MDMMQLEALVDQHGDALYAFCHRLTGNRAEADDLYQDTFLKAVEQCRRIDADRNPKSYLFSIAVYAWKQHRRKIARRHRIAPSAPEETAYACDDGTDMAQMVEDRESMAQVREAVAALDDKLRLPLYLHYTAGMPVEEIAVSLRIPPGTVKSRMHKARTLIRKRLEGNNA